jgi:hypothetical protein
MEKFKPVLVSEVDNPRPDSYGAAATRLTDFLIGHALFDSYSNYEIHGEAYPFVAPDEVLPRHANVAGERRYQNTALIFLLDGTLPPGLNKHFRLRASNRVTWGNLNRIAPHLDCTDYKAAHCALDTAEVEGLLKKLCTLDYAVMVERPATAKGEDPGPCVVTHMHVKVERLTDVAIRNLAVELGYIDRRLFERGEDYVDALEAKYFEYYGFSHNAAGRKSAAAVAAQLFGEYNVRASVFVASQEDARLTVLDDGPLITQYMLIQFSDEDSLRFDAAAKGAGLTSPFPTFRGDGYQVMLYRVRFRRTAAGRPSDERPRSAHDLQAPWIEIESEAILSPESGNRIEIPFAWAKRES